MTKLGPVVDWVFWSIGLCFALSFGAAVLLVVFSAARWLVWATMSYRKFMASELRDLVDGREDQRWFRDRLDLFVFCLHTHPYTIDKMIRVGPVRKRAAE